MKIDGLRAEKERAGDDVAPLWAPEGKLGSVFLIMPKTGQVIEGFGEARRFSLILLLFKGSVLTCIHKIESTPCGEEYSREIG